MKIFGAKNLYFLWLKLIKKRNTLKEIDRSGDQTQSILSYQKPVTESHFVWPLSDSGK